METHTPERHRAILDKWRADNDDHNDSDIIPRKTRRSKRARHHLLAGELDALLWWSRASSHEQAFRTNWLASDFSAGDDVEEASAWRPAPNLHCELEMRPSTHEIMRALKGVKFKTRPDGHKVPVGGDFDVSASGAVMRLGGLRFATESKDEKRAPRRGALTAFGASATYRGRDVFEEFGTPSSGKTHPEDIEASNAHFATLFNAQPHERIAGTRARRAANQKQVETPPTSMTLNEARTSCRLPVRHANDNRPALPCAGASVRESFVGCQVACAPTSADWTELAQDPLADSEEFAKVREKLSGEDVKLLDLAIVCEGLAKIGESLGYTGKAAERQGKKALLVAACRLKTVLNETTG